MRRSTEPPTDTNALGGAYMMGRVEDELCKFIIFSPGFLLRDFSNFCKTRGSERVSSEKPEGHIFASVSSGSGFRTFCKTIQQIRQVAYGPAE